MSDQNKNTGTISAPASTDKGSTTPAPENREPNTGNMPNHEQGREHTPNVDAQKEAADSRRRDEQAHVPTATSKVSEKPNNSDNDRKDNPEPNTGRTAGDAQHTVAEGQADRKPGNDPVKPTSTSGDR